MVKFTNSPETFSDIQFGFHDRAFEVGLGRTEHAIVFFPNGYGASVIRGGVSYGADENLFELGVIIGNESDWHLTYETTITKDVIGRLNENEVMNYLNEIKNLPTK
ncbi:hypothetical protein UFOVP201_4 [uncultured Caudovirales phage]|uniref:Uncharacterized protein n=1 Tax=uncultured Caudovirales phage TaxID=2100421 RepID=A0A6J7WHZ4_9CAUD|nr:hypothetical protein UFOVP201_4 [uncultured Caudovirales phage]